MSRKAREHLRIVDPVLFSYIEKIDLEPLPKRSSDELFAELCDTIISQQLSGKAASTIFARFKKLFPHEMINPHRLASLPEEEIRSCGCSWAKVRSLKDLADKVLGGTVALSTLETKSDHEVVEHLVQIKGIGPWSAEMFLMFALGREDVFSFGDLGLRKGLMKVYGFKTEPSRRQIENIVTKWSPHRSYASRILWKSLEV